MVHPTSAHLLSRFSSEPSPGRGQGARHLSPSKARLARRVTAQTLGLQRTFQVRRRPPGALSSRSREDAGARGAPLAGVSKLHHRPPFSEGLMTMAVRSHDFYGTQKVCSGKGGEAGQERTAPARMETSFCGGTPDAGRRAGTESWVTLTLTLKPPSNTRQPQGAPTASYSRSRSRQPGDLRPQLPPAAPTRERLLGARGFRLAPPLGWGWERSRGGAPGPPSPAPPRPPPRPGLGPERGARRLPRPRRRGC